MATLLTVYVSSPAAPLCERVYEFLDRRGYLYTRVDVDVDSDADREAMRQRTGYSACPVVVAGENVIGKLQDAVAADRDGRLSDVARVGGRTVGG